MTSSGSVVRRRSIRGLRPGSPGTIAGGRSPSPRALVANSKRSSRSLAFREAESGPWQLKQFSARIGWINSL